jgi:hypothetical protein
MEWRLQGEEALIINHRTLDVFTVHKGGNNLYPLPSALFSMPYISDEPPVEYDIRDMPARSPKRIEILDRTPKNSAEREFVNFIIAFAKYYGKTTL